MKAKTKQRLTEILSALREMSDSRDPESVHGEADDLLAEVIRLLGGEIGTEIVEAYDEVPKYYA